MIGNKAVLPCDYRNHPINFHAQIFTFMKLLRLGVTAGILTVCTLNLYAQNSSTVFEVNNVRAEMQSDGQLFTDGQTGKFIPLEPGLAEKTLLQSAGLWIVGKNAAGDFFGAVQTSTQNDFLPGVLPELPPFKLVEGVWEVSCSDIRQHQEDFADNGILDNPNKAVMGWPGAGNPFFSTYNPNQVLPFSDQALAGYYDQGSSFGTYDPDKGDVPALEIRGCPLPPSTADKMAWFALNDQKVNPPSGLKPMGVEVQTQVFAYTSSDQLANKTIFVRYKMINRDTVTLEDGYVGVFADFAVGNPGDDYAGCDPDKQMLFAYNGDDDDENGFGASIPAVGLKVMRGPIEDDGNDFNYLKLSHFMVLDNVDNLQPEEFHRILSGRYPNGSPAPNDGVMFAGNPNDPNANSELAFGNMPGKRVGVASFGPFTLLPGAVNEVIVAYSYAHLPGNTPAENVQLLLENAAGPQSMFDDCFLTTSNECSFSSPVLEPAQQAFRVFPNPGSTSISIETDGLPFSSIAVLNLLGQVVKREDFGIPSSNATLQVEDLQDGVYLLRIGAQTKPVVIQR